MKTIKLITLTFTLSLLLVSETFAAISIGVNFQGRNGSGNPTTPLDPTQSTGVTPVAQTNWNNINDSSMGENGTTAALTDNAGALTAVTLTFQCDDSWNNDATSVSTPDAMLMNGIIKHSRNGDTTSKFTFNNVSEGTYDLYVYHCMNGDSVAVNFWDRDTNTTYYVTQQHQFNDGDIFIQGLNTNPSGTRDTNNYVKFTGLTTHGTGKIGFLAKWISGSDGLGVSGAQLVYAGSPITTVAITAQPVSRRVLVGDTNVTLSVGTWGPVSSWQWYKNDLAITGANGPTYTLPAIVSGDNGARFRVVVTNAVNSVQSSNAVITVGNLVAIPSARERLWYGYTLSEVEDGTVDVITPDKDFGVGVFKTPDEQGDNFADKLEGLFKPLVTGDYVFFVDSDDNSDLFISTDANPANKYMIAQEVDWANDEEWTANSGGTGNHQLTQKRSDQWLVDPTTPGIPPYTNGIHLIAGNSYYLEAAHHEGGGGDFVEATYKLVGEPDPQTGDRTRINGFVLAPYVTSLDGGYIVVTTPPRDTLAFQSTTATFTIAATSGYIGDASSAAPAISYQWQTAPAGSSTYTNILGANGTSYSTPLLTLADDGRKYRVAMIAADAATNSSIATLTMLHDTSPPRPVEISGVSGTLRTVTLVFNELMDKASTENPADYVFTPGNITTTNATLDSSGMIVTIITGTQLTPDVTNTLTITGARDLAGNTVAANTTISFIFHRVTYAADILFDGPLAYYRFDDTVGSAIAHNSGSTGGDGAYFTGNESAPRASDATPSSAKGDPGPRPPAFAGFDAANNSATFDGIGEWVDTKNQFLQHLGTFTLEYWVSTTDRTNQGNRIGIVGQNDAIEYGFIDPNTIQIWTSAGALNTAYSFTNSEWHHVATIAYGTSIKTYYDGQLVGTAATSTTDYGGSVYNVHIGGGGIFDAGNNWFNGNIDEVAIFDKALPAARVAEHYSAGKNGGVITTSGLVSPPLNGRMTIVLSGNYVVIYWTPSGGTLQSKPALNDSPTGWTDIGTANPALVPIGSGASYFRVRFP